MAGDTAEELERFRQQWQEEVTGRSKKASSTSASKAAKSTRSAAKSSLAAGPERNAAPSFHRQYRDTETHDDFDDHGYDDLENKDELQKLDAVGDKSQRTTKQEPNSALEHYERAVEKESEGSLGDSVNHYRKAYRLDAGVDRIYKSKHFPPSSFKSKTSNPNPSNAPVTVPNTAHHSLDGPPASSISQLIASFSSLSIPPAEPLTDASSPPPCPISDLPSEILIHILFQTAITDLASFARLSLVCKHLAYLVTTEDRIWQRVCLGPEIGMAAMHYKWNRTITGNLLPISIDDLDSSLSADFSSLNLTTPPTSTPLPLNPAYPTYKSMLQTRPRLRFNGCYISTVNYIRPGGNTVSQISWSTPVHIVTYYRYLRFFRDGTCASLLTTTEPRDVIHHLTKENMHTHHAGGLPSAVMNNCLRGRWKLSGDPYRIKPTTHIDPANSTTPQLAHEETDPEGTLHIETEGADAIHPNPKYIYKMMLSFKLAGRGVGAMRNN